jgi:hypothetical protein
MEKLAVVQSSDDTSLAFEVGCTGKPLSGCQKRIDRGVAHLLHSHTVSCHGQAERNTNNVVIYVTNTTGIRETHQQCAEMKAVRRWGFARAILHALPPQLK